MCSSTEPALGMSPLRLHILYEHGHNGHPFGSASIRLLRPLTHPVFRGKLDSTAGHSYDGAAVDAVIVDRLWRPDISLSVARDLRKQVSSAGARLLYALDDDLTVLAGESKDWRPTLGQLQALRYFLEESDGILTTTRPLRENLLAYNPHIAVVPNMLDDRLLAGPRVARTAYTPSARQYLIRQWSAISRALRRRRSVTTIGYMGTFTHDDDLLMILPALQELWLRHGDAVAFELLGVAAHERTRRLLQDLPVRVRRPGTHRVEYTKFMPWFSRTVSWDIAVSPLCDTHFNRCKSDIKFLDYCAIGAAGVFSRVPAYSATVRHCETGWLADNTLEAWVEALSTLVTDTTLRHHVAMGAAHYLYSERIVRRAADHWLVAFEQLMA